MALRGDGRTWAERLTSELLYTTYEKRLLDDIDPERLPRHVAVMADGNRRWARLNAPGQELVVGYQAGADKLEEFVTWCDDVGIKVVTLWVLSTDNLRRGSDEVGPLLDVIVRLAQHLAASGRWRVQIVGAPALLPVHVADALAATQRATAGVEGLHVNIAVAYGGRDELRDAVRSLLRAEAERGRTLADVAETLEIESISDHLYTAGQPDPDLVIRTSGEQRVSGFLMWQSAHSEFYFCEALWPDFRRVDFLRALRSYCNRERRYGRRVVLAARTFLARSACGDGRRPRPDAASFLGGVQRPTTPRTASVASGSAAGSNVRPRSGRRPSPPAPFGSHVRLRPGGVPRLRLAPGVPTPAQ